MRKPGVCAQNTRLPIISLTLSAGYSSSVNCTRFAIVNCTSSKRLIYIHTTLDIKLI